MNHRCCRQVIVLLVLIAGAALAPADAPRLVRSEPADGATDVAVDVGALRLHFDRDMRTDSFTVWKSPAGEFPPPLKAEGNPSWLDARTFELKLQRLRPGVQYVVQLNSADRQGFTSADQQPLAITTMRFKTAAASAGRQDLFDPSAEDKQKPPEQRQDIYDPGRQTQDAKPDEQRKPAGVMLKWNAQPGQVSNLSDTGRTKLNLKVSADGAEEAHVVDQLVKLRQRETILAAEDGRPTRMNRRVELAEVMMKDPETGEVGRENLPVTGLDVDLRVRRDGSVTLEQAKQGERDVAAAFAEELAWCSFMPGRVVRVGESWELSGDGLARALAALDAKDGEVTMRLVRVERDPGLKLDVAHIEGRFRGSLTVLGELSAKADGTFTIKFVPDIGLPFLRKIDFRLRVDQRRSDDWESYHITGTGTLEWIEERELLTGAPEAGPSSPARGRDEPAPTRPGAQRPARGASTIAFRRVVEPNERAFSLLVPAGWQVEGGIVRVDPVATNAAPQAIEAKVNMQVKKDRAGTVMAHFLPRIMYIDNRGQPAAPGFPPGSMMNGLPVVYKTSAEDFLVQGVFPRLRPGAQDVRVVEQKKLSHLAAGYQRRMAAIPIVGGQFTFDAAAVTLEYTENGTRFRERMMTLLRDFGAVGAGMWDNHETMTFRAPAGEFERWERVVRVMLTSVQVNQQWLAGELRGQLIRQGIMNDVDRRIREIDREIVAHRQQTNAEINNDMFLTLTGQEEYVNPHTKQVETDSGDWAHRWVTDGGDVIFTDNESYNPNTDPHSPINRTDFQRSAVRPRRP